MGNGIGPVPVVDNKEPGICWYYKITNSKSNLSSGQLGSVKYEEVSAYLLKFMTEFFDIEGYSYEFSNWSTIEEAMESIGQQAPQR